MKAMKYILMVISMVGVLSVNAQQQTEQPNVQFQSTSTLQGSGSVLSSQPMLNADGTAYSPAAAPGKNIRRATKDEGDDEITIVTPGQGGSQAPLGDAVLPLLLMAMAYAVYSVARVYRRKRRV